MYGMAAPVQVVGNVGCALPFAWRTTRQRFRTGKAVMAEFCRRTARCLLGQRDSSTSGNVLKDKINYQEERVDP
jgi:hypothetical protein